MSEQQSPPPQIKPLTEAELADIEANNKLLKVFSGYITELEQLNPGIQLDASLLFGAFTVGCAAVSSANESITLAAHKEIHQLRMLGYTMYVAANGQDKEAP